MAAVFFSVLIIVLHIHRNLRTTPPETHSDGIGQPSE
jgi:hypothetical protein